jgi:hypothetical protein
MPEGSEKGESNWPKIQIQRRREDLSERFQYLNQDQKAVKTNRGSLHFFISFFSQLYAVLNLDSGGHGLTTKS